MNHLDDFGFNKGPDLGIELGNLFMPDSSDEESIEEKTKKLDHNEMETIRVCIEIEEWFRTYINKEMPKKQILYYLDRKAFKIPISNFFDALEIVKNTIYAIGLLPFRKGTEHSTGYYICQLWPLCDLAYTNGLKEMPLCKLSDIKTYCGIQFKFKIELYREFHYRGKPYHVVGPHRLPALRKEDFEETVE
jgi:hypothetical protein